MINRFFALIKDQSGATAIEYGIIGALIAVAAIVSMAKIGHTLSNTFSTVATNVSTKSR